MGRIIFILAISFGMLCCTPKGPQTFESTYIGKNEAYLLKMKGAPEHVKNFSDSKAYIYITKEDYFGKNPKNLDPQAEPKKRFEIEYIYYINKEGVIYKYQVWRKKVN